jgi:hypothetical protein
MARDAGDGDVECRLETGEQFQLLFVSQAVRPCDLLCPLDRFQRVGNGEHIVLDDRPMP